MYIGELYECQTCGMVILCIKAAGSDATAPTCHNAPMRMVIIEFPEEELQRKAKLQRDIERIRKEHFGRD